MVESDKVVNDVEKPSTETYEKYGLDPSAVENADENLVIRCQLLESSSTIDEIREIWSLNSGEVALKGLFTDKVETMDFISNHSIIDWIQTFWTIPPGFFSTLLTLGIT